MLSEVLCKLGPIVAPPSILHIHRQAISFPQVQIHYLSINLALANRRLLFVATENPVVLFAPAVVPGACIFLRFEILPTLAVFFLVHLVTLGKGRKNAESTH